jgi:hypothetical protein
VDFKSASTGMYYLKIYSAVGSVVYESKLVCVEGDNNFKLKTDYLLPGVYYMVIQGDAGEKGSKVVFNK